MFASQRRSRAAEILTAYIVLKHPVLGCCLLLRFFKKIALGNGEKSGERGSFSQSYLFALPKTRSYEEGRSHVRIFLECAL